MHEHIKKLWVDALRSGNYQQGIGQLRCGDTYCCLGVLCDLYDRDQGGPGWHDKDTTYLRCDALLPGEVAKWAGIIAVDPDFALTGEFNVSLPDFRVDDPSCANHEYDLSSQNLTDVNDNGFSFLQIADLIESNL
jgi:hypothetical protein